MKKTLQLSLVILGTIALGACGRSDSKNETPQTPEAPAPMPQPAPEKTEKAPESTDTENSQTVTSSETANTSSSETASRVSTTTSGTATSSAFRLVQDENARFENRTIINPFDPNREEANVRVLLPFLNTESKTETASSSETATASETASETATATESAISTQTTTGTTGTGTSTGIHASTSAEFLNNSNSTRLFVSKEGYAIGFVRFHDNQDKYRLVEGNNPKSLADLKVIENTDYSLKEIESKLANYVESKDGAWLGFSEADSDAITFFKYAAADLKPEVSAKEAKSLKSVLYSLFHVKTAVEVYEESNYGPRF